MSVTIVTWKEFMDRWHEDPQKLLAWLTRLFWNAEIDPASPAMWKALDGEIIIGTSSLGHRVTLRLCDKCATAIPFVKSVTIVSEEECQCLCHKCAVKTT